MTDQLQVGDKIAVFETIAHIVRIEGDWAHFDGTHYGKTSHGARAIGRCQLTDTQLRIETHANSPVSA